MRKLRVVVLMDEDLVPPDSIEGCSDEELLTWKTEYDVVAGLEELGHDVLPLGVSDDLSVIRKALARYRPHIAFNLLEEFQGVAVFDQHVISYLELMRQPYTGCNPRGLMLAHDKALSKKILAYHRIRTPKFLVFERNRAVKIVRQQAVYPLLVKSVIEEASLGISDESIVHSDQQLRDRVAYVHDQLKTDALAEQFIEGREFYVGVIGNRRLQTFPVWEMIFRNLPENIANIATARVKWDPVYQQQLGVTTRAARGLPPPVAATIDKLCKRVFRVLCLSGYARMDLRMTADHRVYILEANPNPNLSYGEDFAESAHTAGVAYGQLLQRILNLGLSYKPQWYG
jgi:D-alanine-D-alanine ligase